MHIIDLLWLAEGCGERSTLPPWIAPWRDPVSKECAKILLGRKLKNQSLGMKRRLWAWK